MTETKLKEKGIKKDAPSSSTEDAKGEKNTPISKSKSKEKSKTKNILIIVGIIFLFFICWAVIDFNKWKKEREEEISDLKREYNVLVESTAGIETNYKAIVSTALKQIDEEAGQALADDAEKLSSIALECLNTFDYDLSEDDPYALGVDITDLPDIEDDEIEYYNEAIDVYSELRSRFYYIKDNLSNCQDVFTREVQASRTTIDEEKRIQEEEAARQAEIYAKASMTYEKFTNQVYEGMTLQQLKEVWTSFDYDCEIFSQSGAYVSYSCDLSTTYNLKVLSFVFYNNRLEAKSQVGL